MRKPAPPVALAFWAHRMLHLDLDGRYADVMELALFNGALTGLSRDGKHYIYANPLESRGQHRRWAWHVCPCCTMNVSRLVGSIAGYAVAAGDDGVAFHLYGGFETSVTIGGGKATFRERSAYTWSGDIRIEAGELRPQAAHSRMGKRSNRGGQRRGDRARPGSRLRDHPSPLEFWRRRDHASADAAGAPLRPSERAHGRQAGRAQARSAHLLRRRGPTIRADWSRVWRCRATRRSTPSGGTTCSAG